MTIRSPMSFDPSPVRLATGHVAGNCVRLHIQRRSVQAGSHSRAMTLVELLIVITIILLLMAVSIPLIRPALKEGALREASRQLNAQLALAKARAAQRGQRTGISIQRTAAGANSALDVFIVEEPLPYAGDVVEAKTLMSEFPLGSGRVQRAHFDISGSALEYAALNSATLSKLVSVGDRIKFDYRGATYIVTNVVTSGLLVTDIVFRPSATICNPGADRRWGVANFDDDGDGIIDNQSEAFAVGSDDIAPMLPLGAVVPYQLYRQPRRTSVKPLQIASGACVDTEWSGIGAIGTQFAAAAPVTIGANTYLDNQPIVILFEPGGSLASVMKGVFSPATNTFALTELIVDGPLHLLVGRFEQAAPAPPATSAEEITNLADSTCLWVSVSDRNGAITSAENDGSAASIDLARVFARSGQTMGGR